MSAAVRPVGAPESSAPRDAGAKGARGRETPFRRFFSDDRLNPIVVKELRQAVQGKALATILVFILFVEILFLGFTLFSIRMGPAGAPQRVDAGREVFSVLFGVLFFVSLFFVPLYTGIRMAFERSDANLDLLFITTLTPRAIIGGKLLAGAYLTVLLFSACLPFMALTYFLRGIDLPTIAMILAAAFVTVAAATQVAILVAALPTSRIFKVLLGFAGLALLFTLFVSGLGMSYALTHTGVAGFSFSMGAGAGGLTVLLGAVFTGVLAFVFSVAAIMPPASDRARPVRKTILGVWLLSGAATLAQGRFLGSAGGETPFVVWLVLATALLGLSLIAAVSERETLGPRVRRSIPEAGLERAIAFLFTSGRAGGLAFGVILIGATFLVATQATGLMKLSRSPDISSALEKMLGVDLYLLAYALTALLVASRLKGRLPPGTTWIVALVLVVFGAWIPPLLGVLFFQARDSASLFPWLALNPFAALDGAHASVYLTVAGFWAGIASLLSIPWFLSEVRAFRPLREP